MVVASVTEFENDFEKYARLVDGGEEVVVMRRGREIGRFVPPERKRKYLTGSLRGILKHDYDDKEARDEHAAERFDSGRERFPANA